MEEILIALIHPLAYSSGLLRYPNVKSEAVVYSDVQLSRSVRGSRIQLNHGVNELRLHIVFRYRIREAKGKLLNVLFRENNEPILVCKINDSIKSANSKQAECFPLAIVH